MDALAIVSVILAVLVLVFFWRYRQLRRDLADYVRIVRDKAEGKFPGPLPVDVKRLENLSNVVSAILSTFNLQLSTIEAERAKLAAVLDTMTDSVLIADAEGRIQFANPASERLFEYKNALGRSVTEVLRHHQLVEVWRKCRATGEAQEETIELPARRQFLRLLVIPDKYTGGSLLLVQDLTRLRRLETMRRDFVSNLSHELRTP
ncbi:MAG: PAS domain-containing protein, partial [Chloroflexota bacterium]